MSLIYIASIYSTAAAITLEWQVPGGGPGESLVRIHKPPRCMKFSLKDDLRLIYVLLSQYIGL